MKNRFFRNDETAWKRINHAFFIAIAVFLLSRAALGQTWYAEIDSNALPTISMQYHGSILMDEGDLKLAQRDFPGLYEGINTYDDLRSAKLLQTDNGKWMAWYFPIYPLFCMPMKLFFQIIHVDQSRCFHITNALLVLASVWTVLNRLKASPQKRFAAAALLMMSPIIYYINYINYEAFLFSMITISLVCYINREKCKSAFFLSLGGMANSTAMAIGIVMIAEYCIDVLKKNHKSWSKRRAKECLTETAVYGCCFLPSLVPFLTQFLYRGKSTYGEWITFREYIGVRFLTYLFDPTVGFVSFAPVLLVLFFTCVVFACCRKQYHSLVWMFFLLGAVAAFSLMFHINCGMIYCARYLVWSYPLIPLYICSEGITGFSKKSVQIVSLAAASLVTCLVMGLNQCKGNVLDSCDFNYLTKQILNEAPQLYNPYSATFYCRTLHIDGAYDCTEPAYYCDSESGYIRKIIFKATEKGKTAVKEIVSGNPASMEELYRQLDKIPMDGKFHYINFSRYDAAQLIPAPQSLSSDTVIFFSGENRNADLYVTRGLSSNEGAFAWTDGDTLKISFVLSDYEPQSSYRMKLYCVGTFNGEQCVEVSQNTVSDKLSRTLNGSGEIEFEIVPDEKGTVELTLTFPNAASPKELRQSNDMRRLAIQLQYGVISKK